MRKNDDINLIIKRIKKSDQGAYKLFFDSYYLRVKSYFITRINNNDEAQDLSQKVFIKIWNAREDLKENNNIEVYLFKVCRNVLIDHFRSRKIIFDNDELENIPSQESRGTNTDSISEKITTLLDSLSYKHRITFTLNRLDGMTYREIANSFDLSVKTVEKRISYVLKFLRENI